MKKRKKKPTVDVDVVCLKCKHPMRVKVFRKVVMPGTPAEVEFETFVEDDNQRLLFDEEGKKTSKGVKVKSDEGKVEGLDEKSKGKEKGK